MTPAQEIKRANTISRESGALELARKVFRKASSNAGAETLALNALRHGAVIPCEVNAAGEIISPPKGAAAWSKPLRDEATVRAAFAANPQFNAAALCYSFGEVAFIGAPGAAHVMKFATAKSSAPRAVTPSSAPVPQDDGDSALRGTVDRVVSAGLARNAKTNPNVEAVMRAAGYVARQEEKPQ